MRRRTGSIQQLGPNKYRVRISNGRHPITGTVGPVHIDQLMQCDSCNWSGLIIDGNVQGDTGFVDLTELVAGTNTFMEVAHMLTTDDLNRMVIEISLGWNWQDPRSRIPNTPEHQQNWHRLEQEIAEIRARGHAVEIPDEWPDLTDYEPGSA